LRAGITEGVIIVAASDVVGVNKVLRRGSKGLGRGRGGLWTDRPIDRDRQAHRAKEPLQNLHRLSAHVHIGVKNRRLKRSRKAAYPRLLEIVFDKNLRRRLTPEGLHIGHVNLVVAVDVTAKPLERSERHPVVGRPARIVGIIDKAAFAGHNLACDIQD